MMSRTKLLVFRSRRSWRSRIYFSLSAVLALAGSACSNSSSTNPSTGQPGAPSQSWSSVNAQATLTSASCDRPETFDISSSGSFVITPCLTRSASQSGQITAQELDHLNTLVTPILNQPGTQQCVNQSVGFDMSLDIHQANGNVSHAYQSSNTQTCYLGDASDAQALAEYILELLNEYAPAS